MSAAAGILGLGFLILLVLVLLVVITVIVQVKAGSLPGWWRPAARVLRFVAAVLLLVSALGAVVYGRADAGSAIWLIAGVPAIVAVLLAVATAKDSAVVLITWCSAVAMLGWSIVNIVGIGLFLLIPTAILLFAASVTTGPERQPSGPAPRSATGVA